MKNNTTKYIIIIILLVIIFVLSFYLIKNKTSKLELKDEAQNLEIQNENTNSIKKDLAINDEIKDTKQDILKNPTKMIMYKSPNCGCCSGYAEEMEKQGFEVEVIKVDDMSTIKNKYNIPRDKQSCHTSVIDNYFIEGHVPVEAVIKLLKERPKIDGIGLPGMPIGTPGMPGIKRGDYEIYKSIDGNFLEYLKI